MYHAWKRPGRKPSTVSRLSGVCDLDFCAARYELTAKRNVDQTVSRADASLHPYCERWEDDGDKAEKDIAAAHVGLVLLICRAVCVRGVEKTVRSSWRESRLQVTCHAESGCLECGCARGYGMTTRVAVAFPHSCSARVTCLRAVLIHLHPSIPMRELVYRTDRPATL